MPAGLPEIRLFRLHDIYIYVYLYINRPAIYLHYNRLNYIHIILLLHRTAWHLTIPVIFFQSVYIVILYRRHGTGRMQFQIQYLFFKKSTIEVHETRSLFTNMYPLYNIYKIYMRHKYNNIESITRFNNLTENIGQVVYIIHCNNSTT